MGVNIVKRCIGFEVRKLFYKIRYGKRFGSGHRCKSDRGVSILIDSKNAGITLGDRVSLRKNVEISAFGEGRISIGKGVFVNRNTIICAYESIIISDSVTIGPNVCIYDHNHDRSSPSGFSSKGIVIGKGAWIGANVCILMGCRIGENAVIGAGAVVTKDVPDNTVLVQRRENIYRGL